MLKHAGASSTKLEITFQKQMVKVTIHDNGIGFEVDITQARASAGNHFGLIGMRERIELLEGRLDIESAKGQGTHISMLIPIGSEPQ